MIYDGMAGKKHQNNNFHCTKSTFRNFWTCHFLKLSKLYLPKKISYDICKVFLTFVSVVLIASNGWTITLCWKINSDFTTYTHIHTHIHTYIHTYTINSITYLNRSTASFLLFFLGKGSPRQHCFHQTKCGRLKVI